MPNFYTDNPDLVAQLDRLDLARIVAWREDDYAQARDFAYAPRDYEDAVDSYRRTLEIVGDIAGDFVEPRAEDVDRAGSVLADGEVCYAPGIARVARAPAPGRPHGHHAAAPVRRPQLPRHRLGDDRRDGLARRPGADEHLRPAGHRRDGQQVRLGRDEGGLPAALRQRRGHRVDGAHRAGGRQRPAERAAQGDAGRRRHLAPQRRQALHHQRLRPHQPRAGALGGRARRTRAASRCSSTSATSTCRSAASRTSSASTARRPASCSSTTRRRCSSASAGAA